MTKPSQTKQYWQMDTKSIAKAIKAAALSARTEEDLKMSVEPILQKAYREIGINIDLVQYEKRTGLRAKMDAVYGYLIIEYKRPKYLKNSRDVTQAQVQLQKYLTEEARSHHPNEQQFLEKAVGVAIDGEKILFVRYSRTERILSTPIPIEEPQKRLFVQKPVTAGFSRLGPYEIKEEPSQPAHLCEGYGKAPSHGRGPCSGLWS